MKLTQAIFALAVFLLVSATASAQTINHAWFAKGHAWVVWEATPPVPETYRIYKSAVPFGPSIAGAEQVGRLYKADWEGARLKPALPPGRCASPIPWAGRKRSPPARASSPTRRTPPRPSTSPSSRTVKPR